MSKRSEWTVLARETIKKARERVRGGWDFVGPDIRGCIIDAEILSVIQGWAVTDARTAEPGPARHMAECIIAFRSAVLAEIGDE